MKNYKKKNNLSIKDIEDSIKKFLKEDDLQLYKDLGGGLYELPNCVIANKIGLYNYLVKLKKEIRKNGLRKSI